MVKMYAELQRNEAIDVNIKRFTITKLKTTVIKEFAEERGMTFVKLNLGELEEVGDLTGFPVKEFKINELDENGNVIATKWVAHDLLSTYFTKPCETYEITDESRMGYATPAWLPREENPNGVILLLDDYTRKLLN